MNKKTIYQLGYKVDLIPNDVPKVDCRIIKNPYPLRGKEARDIVRKDERFEGLVRKGVKILSLNDSVVVMCQYGVHRSGGVSEEIMNRLRENGVEVEIRRGVRSFNKRF